MPLALHCQPKKARRYAALFWMGIEDLKAARLVIGKHRNSSNKLIGEAVEYIYIACQIQERHHQEMIAYITDDQVDPDGPGYDATKASLQSYREIFKDASSLARHTLLDTRGPDKGDTITHFTSRETSARCWWTKSIFFRR